MSGPRRRSWSIRTRTALALGAVSATLAALVLVFVAVLTQHGVGTFVSGSAVHVGDPDRTTEPSGPVAQEAPVRGSAVGGVALQAVAAREQWLWSAVGVGIAGVLATGVGWLVSERMLRPIEDITATARRISATTLHERIGLDGPDDELRRLARTIDALFERLDTAFESQRRFVAHVSHELRTPLAVQRAAIQIGLDDDADPTDVRRTREELLAANRRSEQLIEGLLVLAEADRGLGDRIGPVDVEALVQDVLVLHRASAAAVGVELVVDTAGSATVRGDRVLLHQLVTNLVDNAIAYNRPGGTVWVRVAPDGAVLEVENTGTPIEPDAVPVLLEPFRRGPDGVAGGGRDRAGSTAGPSRPHSGIGLSVVAAVTRVHGWTLAVDARSGGGLVVGLRMPASGVSMM
ncbi:sensor histidine kinase [Curtobacterium sp. RRHDQ10]|uniref:sensor histidine kinase n=1 Tax=Curtobacterium phyllosphaerae TaxID=3413379 RepID=UPI003BEFB65D